MLTQPTPPDDEGSTALGQRIRATRIERKMTQEALAAASDCTKGAVSQWEKGNVKNLRMERLFRVADALGVYVRWLAIGTGAKIPLVAKPFGDDKLLMQLINLYDQLGDDRRHELTRYANYLLTQDNPAQSPSNPYPNAPFENELTKAHTSIRKPK